MRPKARSRCWWSLAATTGLLVVAFVASTKVHAGANVGRLALGVSRGAIHAVLWNKPKKAWLSVRWLHSAPGVTEVGVIDDWFWWFGWDSGGQPRMQVST